MRSILVAFTVMVLGGCQTPSRLHDLSLPTIHSGLFSECSGGEGGGQLTVKVENLAEKVELDWMQRPDFEGRVYNPLGQTMLKISRIQDRLIFGGRMASGLPDVTIDEEGFLETDGVSLGVKMAEVGCFLRHRWPRDWLENVIGARTQGGRTRLNISMEGRDIDLYLNTGKGGVTRTCSQITWNIFWILVRSEAEVCILGEGRELTVEASDLKLRWVKDDGA